MADQSMLPKLPHEEIRQILLDKFEENKKVIKELSDEELLSISAGGLSVGPQRMRWNILGGVGIALCVPSMQAMFKKPPTQAG